MDAELTKDNKEKEEIDSVIEKISSSAIEFRNNTGDSIFERLRRLFQTKQKQITRDSRLAEIFPDNFNEADWDELEKIGLKIPGLKRAKTGWTTEKLKQLHTSVPANPLIAEPLYLSGYIERLGTGTTDIMEKCLAAKLPEPQFIQAEDFRSILFRPSSDQVTDQVPAKYRPSTEELPQEYRSSTVEVRKLVIVMDGEMNRLELQQKLELTHEGNFRDGYLVPALNEGIIEMKYPQKNHPKQKYRLTTKGEALQALLKKKK